MTPQLTAILVDLGDTILVEETEVKDTEGTTLRADLVPGMAAALRRCKERGYPLALVADSRPDTPGNVLRQHGLLDLFDCLAISDVIGASKPDPLIFRVALDALSIKDDDYGRVVMVGNNLERDVAGANRLGLISVFFHWNERRRTRPLTQEENPRYVVSSAQELTDLIGSLETRDTSTIGAETCPSSKPSSLS
jgi:FMN phosphatase YigB (HAD superfamily)